MPQLVRSRAGGDLGRVALVVDGTHALTFGQWWRRARPVAAGLATLGARPGDRVGLGFDGSTPEGWLEHAVAVLAGYLSGVTVVGLSLDIGADELGRRLRRCGAVGLVHGPGIEVPGTGGWSLTLDEVAARGDGDVPEPEVDPGAIAEIIHTSGTTGAAKAVAVPHANLTFGHATGGRLPGTGPSVLAPVGLGTNAGHSAVLIALVGGSTVHVLTDTSAPSVAAAIGGTGAGMVIMPAPLATRLVAEDLLTGVDLAAVRAVMLGSTAVPGAVVARLRALLPEAALSIGYGSTEAAPASTQLVVGGEPVPAGSVGQPRPGTDVEIRDDAGRPLAAGETGHVWLRSAAPPRWYLTPDGAPDGGAPDDGTFHDGWTRMGDLGYLDPDGGLRLVDRAADAIVRDGRRISGLRVEDALYWHPDVTAAAVVLVPDGGRGRLVAAVETRDGADPAAIRRFAADRLEPHEVPDVVLRVDALPRGGLGKVLKRRLRTDLVAV